MNSVLCAISSEKCTERARCLLLCFFCVSRSDESSPSLDCTIFDKFHAYYNIASDELLKSCIERLSDVLAIENVGGILRKFGHLQLIYLETLRLDSINYFSKILVTARLNHGKG